MDRAVSQRQQFEMEAIINRFPIDLELEIGASFTERIAYTGIYNISGLGFDISFRVQCSENYYGPNCTTLCEPVEGVYTCDSEGRVVCVQNNRDLATNCTSCLHGWDLKTNCTSCSPLYDNRSDCTQCLAGRNINTGCVACLPGYDPSTNCTECFLGYDLCTKCLPDGQCQPTQEPLTTTTTLGKFEPQHTVRHKESPPVCTLSFMHAGSVTTTIDSTTTTDGSVSYTIDSTITTDGSVSYIDSTTATDGSVSYTIDSTTTTDGSVSYTTLNFR